MVSTPGQVLQRSMTRQGPGCWNVKYVGGTKSSKVSQIHEKFQWFIPGVVVAGGSQAAPMAGCRSTSSFDVTLAEHRSHQPPARPVFRPTVVSLGDALDWPSLTGAWLCWLPSPPPSTPQYPADLIVFLPSPFYPSFMPQSHSICTSGHKTTREQKTTDKRQESSSVLSVVAWHPAVSRLE